MTNADVVYAFVRAHPACTDTEIRKGTGIEPHQQVNQIARRLEQAGRIRRNRGGDGLIRNSLVNLTSETLKTVNTSGRRSKVDGSASTVTQPQPALASSHLSELPTPGRSTVVVLPCSGEKRLGGGRMERRPSVLDVIAVDVAQRLSDCQASVHASMSMDTDELMPAWYRYNGRVYQAAADDLARYVAADLQMLIVSGGYGVVLAREPIAGYNRVYRPSDWPNHVVADAIASYAQEVGAQSLIAFVSPSTGYRKSLTAISWRSRGLAMTIVSPIGGNTDATPRACGEAFAAWFAGRLTDGWTSGADLRLVASRA